MTTPVDLFTTVEDLVAGASTSTDAAAASAAAAAASATKAAAGAVRYLHYVVPGTLTVAAGTARFPFPVAAAIDGISLAVGTAATGTGSVTVDVNKNGTTIFTTQANRPKVLVTANATAAEVTNADVTAIAAGDYLTFDVDVVGGTVAGADLTVVVRYHLS